jgi:hypothetical protein
VLAGSAPGCTTETKAADASAGAAVDANIAAPAPFDAGIPVPDASLLMDAGIIPVGTDAGPTIGTAPLNTPVGTIAGSVPGKATAFDRILAKPKAMPKDFGVITSSVEKKTGHKVALVRRTAGTWLLFQFAPTPNGRDQGDQQKLVDVLKGMDELESVEGDRLMKIKMP